MQGWRNTTIGAVLVLAAWGAGPAGATSHTWNLAYTITGGTATYGQIWGTLTVSDDGSDAKAVDVDIRLANPYQKIVEFALNYTGTAAGLFDTVTGRPVTLAPDAVRVPGGSGNFLFDVADPSKGNLDAQSAAGATGRYFTVLTASGDLNADDFNARNFSAAGAYDGLLYGAVHVGAPGGTDLDPFPVSLSLGATDRWTPTCGEPPTGTVPEPGTMLLLGSGLLAAACLARRGVKKS